MNKVARDYLAHEAIGMETRGQGGSNLLPSPNFYGLSMGI